MSGCFFSTAWAQESVELEIPSYNYDELYNRNIKLSTLEKELEQISDNIAEIESSRKAKSFKLLFFDVPCCGKEPLNDAQALEKNQLIRDRFKLARQFEGELSDYRESLRTLLSPKELEEIYSGNDDSKYFGLVPAGGSLKNLEKKKELILQKTLQLPTEDKLEDVSYLYFKPVILPNGVTLKITGNRADNSDVETFTYKEEQLALIDGEVGPLVGETIDINLIYSPGTDKTDLLYISDILLQWEGTKRLDLNPKFGPEQAILGAETSGFECGGEDKRAPVESKTYPFVGRLAYNNDIFCSAFFLEDDIVATAGHCISTIKWGNSKFNKNRPKDDLSKVHFETHTKVSAWQDGRPKISAPEHRFNLVKGSLKCSSCPDTPSFVAEVPDWNDAHKFELGKDWATFRVRPQNTNITLKDYKVNYGINNLSLYDYSSNKVDMHEAIIVGHGIDNEFERNKAMQADRGGVKMLDSRSSPTGTPILIYNIHTRSGSSGSPVISLKNEHKGQLLGIHTHGFCETTPLGRVPKNSATLIDRSNF